MDGIASASRDRLVQDNLRLFKEMKAYSEEVTPHPPFLALYVYLMGRDEGTVFEPKSLSTIKTRLFEIQSFTAATQLLIIVPAQSTKCTPSTILLALSSIPWRVSLMRCVWWNTKIAMHSMQGCWKRWGWDPSRSTAWVNWISSRQSWVRGNSNGLWNKRLSLVGMIRGSLLLKVLLPFILLVVDVVGIMRRGCVIEALRKFIFSQGPSKNINNLEWASFWAENKKVIDPVAKRFTCINDEKRFHPHFHSRLTY